MILHTTSTGKGEPIIFIHQALQTSETDFPEQRIFFEKNYRVIQIDLRGHGKSVTSNFNSYIETSANDLKETMESLQIDRAHIIGSSLGSLVGLVFAKRYADKVVSLTLSGILAEQPDNWVEHAAEAAAEENQIAASEDAIEYFNLIHEGDWRSLLKSFQPAEWYPFEETMDLSTLTMPVLFLVGEKQMLEVAGVTKYPKQNNRVHVSIIPFAGHLPHLEQPDIYNKIVELFLLETKEKS